MYNRGGYIIDKFCYAYFSKFFTLKLCKSNKHLIYDKIKLKEHFVLYEGIY